MKIHASGEDYLEAVLILQKKQGMVRSIDLARHMGFSKPSISHAVGVLRDGGFLGRGWISPPDRYRPGGGRENL